MPFTFIAFGGILYHFSVWPLSLWQKVQNIKVVIKTDSERKSSNKNACLNSNCPRSYFLFCCRTNGIAVHRDRNPSRGHVTITCSSAWYTLNFVPCYCDCVLVDFTAIDTSTWNFRSWCVGHPICSTVFVGCEPDLQLVLSLHIGCWVFT